VKIRTDARTEQLTLGACAWFRTSGNRRRALKKQARRVMYVFGAVVATIESKARASKKLPGQARHFDETTEELHKV
jgi:hypothetical protein